MNEKYYVYRATYNDIVVYIGKGSGQRINNKERNKWFNLFDCDLNFKREYVFEGLTERQALTLEAQLIEEYGPIFNLKDGLLAKKWVDLGSPSLDTYLNAKRNGAVGANSETPDTVAKQLVSELKLSGTESIVFAEDRFGVLVHEFFNIFPNHKGEVTVFETDPEKLIALSKAINNRQNVSIKACNYLESNVKGDIVIMNPPFTAPNSNVRIWKKFLNKASDSLVYAIVPHSGNNFNYEHEILISAFKFETCSFHGDLIKVQPHPPKLVKEKAECRYDVKLKGYYNATPDSDYIAFQINHYGEPGLNNPLDKGRAYIVVTGNDVHLIAQKLKNASWETAMRNNRVKHSGGLCHMNHSDVIRWINEL